MAKYQKKPVTIEAMQLFIGNYNRVSDWITTNGGKVSGTGGGDAGVHLIIETLEGDMRANEGDYIIQGLNGEFYPCKPDIFAKTYEPSIPDLDRGLI